jgi:hypothetical protein
MASQPSFATDTFTIRPTVERSFKSPVWLAPRPEDMAKEGGLPRVLPPRQPPVRLPPRPEDMAHEGDRPKVLPPRQPPVRLGHHLLIPRAARTGGVWRSIVGVWRCLSDPSRTVHSTRVLAPSRLPSKNRLQKVQTPRFSGQTPTNTAKGRQSQTSGHIDRGNGGLHLGLSPPTRNRTDTAP